MNAPPPTTLRVAMRFERTDARNLRAAADRAKVKDLAADVSTFDLAADAAENGEPLIFVCASLDEARLIAHGYSLHGCKVPTIEEGRGA